MPDTAAQFTITIDDRENRSGLPAALSRLWSRVAVGRLPVGDIEIGSRILIERKTVGDFVASLADGRLYSQAYALNGACHRPLLIVEGTDATPFMDISPRSLRGAILSLAVGYRIPVLRTDDVEETAQFIAHVAEQEVRRRERSAQRTTDSPKRRPQRVAMDVLGAIPGVGDLRARRLIDRFGAVGAVLAATDAELEDVPGVGPAVARSVRRAAAPPEDEVRETAPGYARRPPCARRTSMNSRL